METISSSPTTASAVCRLADGPDELEAHFAVRRRVFVHDQALFAVTDKDELDWTAGTLHVVGVADGVVVGAVRLYPVDADGLWKGDRLGVLPEARVRRLGAELVRFAVATAGEHGGHTMVAQIQLPNVRFFEHLGWHADGPPAPYHGVMHQPMAIPLAPAP
ncbi:MAG TPA: MSMEG_0567/Sll0786 family nitrogen starvation N-acetyltransferase [Solirubrobacteraceae bacterium]|nr:MSMEG_0567/Sll0786 family nitrogen starvation N-acetyltransferase [Solirubrobacteraceae bacterium]